MTKDDAEGARLTLRAALAVLSVAGWLAIGAADVPKGASVGAALPAGPAQTVWLDSIHLPLALRAGVPPDWPTAAAPAPSATDPAPSPTDPTPASTTPAPTRLPTETQSPTATLGATQSATLLPNETQSPTAAIGATPSTTPTSDSSADCGSIPTIADYLSPSRELFVGPGGDDDNDGSRSSPFATVRGAARQARPGSAIRILPGTYPDRVYLEAVDGTESEPIWIGGDDAENPPHFTSSNGIQISRASWLVVHDLEISGSQSNGLNIDDGGDGSSARLHHVSVERVNIHDIGGTGNQDCLKLSGITDFTVLDSQFARCGGGGSGSGIDMVGAHRGLIARSEFVEMSGNAVQAKGGAEDIEVRWNRMRNAGHRAVNMGGSTGFEFFRPPLSIESENFEARDIRVLANIIEGGVTPFAFVGCIECLAAQNTIVNPERWLFRILQETTSRDGYEFAPARDGRLENNLVVFDRSQLSTTVNIGPNTAPETFRFSHNLWFASDDPSRSAPDLPAPETGGIAGADPELRADHSIGLNSPAAGAGTRGSVRGDITGTCYADPPSIGAYEARD